MTVAPTCLFCGHAGVLGDRFCGACGKPLASAPTGDAFRSRSVAQRLASDGERKQVTVLFADLSGSTAAIENLDPEAAFDQLEPALQIMTRLVQRYEGIVCRRMGDGILALFGAPIAHEDHAIRACFAALGIQQEMRGAGAADTVRIGLNSGDVLYRTVPSELGLEIDLAGLTVHIASRMEKMAPPGSVYLTGETQALTQGLIETRSIGLRQVKGTSALSLVHEAIGASPYRSRWQTLATRERAPFAGRAPERRELMTALTSLAAGRGGVVGIRGEAGLGKSRLVRRVIEEDSPLREYRVTVASTTAFGGGVSYHALVSALRDLFGISESADAALVRQAVAAGLEQVDPALACDAPILSSLILLSSATKEWLAMDPRGKRNSVRDSCVRLVRAMTRKVPAIFIFEDLHWIDHDSQYALEAVCELARHEPLLVVLTYRTEYDASWLPPMNGRLLHIRPLSDEEVSHSLRDWFLGGDAAEHFIQRLVARVGGNPLFLEECVRTLAQQGALTAVSTDDPAGSGTRRRYACLRAPASIDMSPSMRDVIASRIDRRSSACVILLNTLSVVNRRIPLWLIEKISDRPPAETGATVGEAVAAEILMSITLSPEVEYSFTHAVLREVAHDSLTRARRIEAHRSVFRAIETHHAGRLQDHTEWLALHASEGALWEQAAVYQGLAGERALARGSYAEAIGNIRSALKSYDHSGHTEAATKQAIDHLLRLRQVLSATGVASEETSSLIDRAEHLAADIGDEVRLGWAWNERCGALWIAGKYREAVTTARRCVEIAQKAGEVRLHASSLQRLGVSLHAIGDVVGATDTLSECCDLLLEDLRFDSIGTTFPTSVLAGGYLVGTLGELGRYEEAEQRLAEVIAVAATSRDVASIGAAQIAHCILSTARGSAAKAIAPLEALLAGVREAGAMQVAQHLKLHLGRAKILVGDAAAAARLLDVAEEVESLRHSYIYRLTKVCYAEALVALGVVGEAEAILDQVEGDVAARGEAGTLVHCCVVRAKLALGRGDPDGATLAYEQALQRATALSMQPVCALCKAALATIASRHMQMALRA